MYLTECGEVPAARAGGGVPVVQGTFAGRLGALPLIQTRSPMTSSLRPPVRLGPLLLFGLLAALVVGIEHAAVHRADFNLHPALPPAVAFDLLVGLPALFYGCVVRRYRLPISTVAAAFGGSLWLAHWLLPGTTLPVLAWAGRLAGVAEVATTGYLLVRLRRVRQGYRAAQTHSTDFIENLHAASQPVLGRLTEAVVTEVAVLRYALVGGWAQPETDPSGQAFPTYQQSGFVALLATFAGLSVLEAAAAHLVVGHWWPRGAWVLTGLSGYSVLWLLAHGQAVRCRPVLLTATTLVVRVGLLWRVAVARPQIVGAEAIVDVPAAAPDLLNTARLLLTPPNLLLTLAAPQCVRGLYGLHRTVRRLAIYVDDPAGLLHQLQASRANT